MWHGDCFAHALQINGPTEASFIIIITIIIIIIIIIIVISIANLFLCVRLLSVCLSVCMSVYPNSSHL